MPALGDKIVPHMEQALGTAGTDRAGKGDYWLVVVLTRIGTPRAVEGLCKAVKHDYPGAMGGDRTTAAAVPNFRKSRRFILSSPPARSRLSKWPAQFWDRPSRPRLGRDYHIKWAIPVKYGVPGMPPNA